MGLVLPNKKINALYRGTCTRQVSRRNNPCDEEKARKWSSIKCYVNTNLHWSRLPVNP